MNASQAITAEAKTLQARVTEIGRLLDEQKPDGTPAVVGLERNTLKQERAHLWAELEKMDVEPVL